nr:efflux transporter outer membrane subunit [Collimonas sp. OK607]
MRIFTYAGLLSFTIGVAACAGIPADRNTLPQQDMARAQLAAGIRLARDGWPDPQWWTQYGDLQLNHLIQQALTNGPTLAIASARIGSARAALATNAADQGSNFNLNASENRQRYSGNGLFPAPIGGNYFNETTLQLQANYDFDWWGKHQSQIAAALGEVNARRADYAQAEQTLAAAITQHYFNLQSAWARLENSHRSVATQRELVQSTVKRIARGLAAIDEQRMDETGLSYLNQHVAQLETQIAIEREALRALLGGDNNALADLVPQLIPGIPHTLPRQLGIELLARRPDLQAARWRVEASLSRIEATHAAFYPNIDLTAAFGLDTLSLSNLFNAASRTLFAGPTLSLPLFDSKRLEARLGAARSERNEMIADYNQTVFNAVRDVAQQGASMQSIESQIRQQDSAMRASNELLRTAQAKFKQGLANHSAVLAAELAQLAQQDAGLQLANRQLLAEVALVSVLGGGYRSNLITPNAPLTQ